MKENSIILAIVGSRNFKNVNLLDEIINNFIQNIGTPYLIISGAAKGADTLARNWANKNNIKIKEYHADWKKYGRGAGFVRNKDIIKIATHVIAFPSIYGKGTQHSIKLAKERKLYLKECWFDKKTTNQKSINQYFNIKNNSVKKRKNIKDSVLIKTKREKTNKK